VNEENDILEICTQWLLVDLSHITSVEILSKIDRKNSTLMQKKI
jgi:hypothetical protein